MSLYSKGSNNRANWLVQTKRRCERLGEFGHGHGSEAKLNCVKRAWGGACIARWYQPFWAGLKLRSAGLRLSGKALNSYKASLAWRQGGNMNSNKNYFSETNIIPLHTLSGGKPHTETVTQTWYGKVLLLLLFYG